MKATAADHALASRFPQEETVHGFGKTQADAGLSTAQIARLLDVGLIKMTSRGVGVSGFDGRWHRHHTSFIRTR